MTGGRTGQVARCGATACRCVPTGRRQIPCTARYPRIGDRPRCLPSASGLDRNRVDMVRRVARPVMHTLHRVGAGRLGQTEDGSGQWVGPGTYETYVLLVLDGEVRLVCG